MKDFDSRSSRMAEADAALERAVRSASAGGDCGGPWSHELTRVVKYCGVVTCDRGPVLQVNPAWLGELVANDELDLLAQEMHTWFAIQGEASRLEVAAA